MSEHKTIFDYLRKREGKNMFKQEKRRHEKVVYRSCCQVSRDISHFSLTIFYLFFFSGRENKDLDLIEDRSAFKNTNIEKRRKREEKRRKSSVFESVMMLLCLCGSVKSSLETRENVLKISSFYTKTNSSK